MDHTRKTSRPVHISDKHKVSKLLDRNGAHSRDKPKSTISTCRKAAFSTWQKDKSTLLEVGTM